MELSKLKYTKGSRGHKVKTYGRGFGSGIGKTSGKGTKGQKARKSGHVRLGFEGGQTPIYRKVPKVGFNNFNFKTNYNVLTVQQLNAIDGTTVDYKSLVASRLIRDNKLPIKIIGNTEVKKAFKVMANVVTDGAKKAIEAAKGSVEIIKLEPKVQVKPKKVVKKAIKK